MNTKIWGKSLWVALDAIVFNYPKKINSNSKKHKELKKYYKQLFLNLQYTLPCKYCRKSYTKFIKEIPVNKFLNSRADLSYWLYLIHDKVNNKLMNQERKALQERYEQINKRKNLTKQQRNRERSKARRQALYTKPSPSYENYCQKVEKYRAKCAKKKGEIPSCRLPLKTLEKGEKIIKIK